MPRTTWRSAHLASRAHRTVGLTAIYLKAENRSQIYAASPSPRNCRACWPARAPALTLSSIEEFRFRNEALGNALQKLYANTPDKELRFGAENLFGAMAELKRLDAKIPFSSERYPAGRFGAGLAQIARLIKADVGIGSGIH